MKWPITAVIVVVAAVAAVLWFCVPHPPQVLFAFYEKNMRGAMFSAFLSLGGFLFSLKTFIVVKMKEGVYDTQQYKDKITDLKRTDRGVTLYGSLRMLQGLLFWSIVFSIGTALAQFSIGFIPHSVAAAFCIATGVGTIVLLALSLVQIRGNLHDWFDALETEFTKKFNEDHPRLPNDA